MKMVESQILKNAVALKKIKENISAANFTSCNVLSVTDFGILKATNCNIVKINSVNATLFIVVP